MWKAHIQLFKNGKEQHKPDIINYSMNTLWFHTENLQFQHDKIILLYNMFTLYPYIVKWSLNLVIFGVPCRKTGRTSSFQRGWIKTPRITSSGSNLHWGGGERGRANQYCWSLGLWVLQSQNSQQRGGQPTDERLLFISAE